MKGYGHLAGIAILAALLLLASCTSPTPEEATPQDSSLQTPGPAGLPEYAYRSALALKGYQIATAERDLLARLPCYCGCGQDPQYQNLRDCFLDEEGEFRSHGANCQVCLEEAEDAAQWKVQGLSVKEIRDRIDGKYEGRGKPTDTPPVTE